MRTVLNRALLALALAAPAHGDGRIVITEIMYNPDSKEQGGRPEWVEIANVGDTIVTVADWHLDDEDRGTWGRFSCELPPRAVAVLINARAVDEAQFRGAWDEPETDDTERVSDARPAATYLVIPVTWGSLANQPDESNEILTLLDADDEVVCEVNFGASDPWPNCKRPDGPSIYLADLEATDLSDPTRWKRSEDGTNGAHANRPTEVFDGTDIGSPGFVQGLSDLDVTAGRAPHDTAEYSGHANADAPDDDIIDY